MYDTILVATDGSNAADRAVERGLDLAKDHGAEIHAMFVVNTRRYAEPALCSSELVLDGLQEEADRLVAEVCERAEGMGIRAVPCICHGDPEEEITAYADEVDADVILVGSRRRLGDRPTGGVGNRLSRRSRRPVLTA